MYADDLEILEWAVKVCEAAEEADHSARADSNGTTEISRGWIPQPPSRSPGCLTGAAELRDVLRRLREQDIADYLRTTR